MCSPSSTSSYSSTRRQERVRVDGGSALKSKQFEASSVYRNGPKARKFYGDWKGQGMFEDITAFNVERVSDKKRSLEMKQYDISQSLSSYRLSSERSPNQDRRRFHQIFL